MESSRSRLNPCTHQGEDYSTCFLPAVPSADLEVGSSSGELSQLPEELQKPLVKTEDGTIIALKRLIDFITYQQWYVHRAM